MFPQNSTTCTAFEGSQRIASGTLAEVVRLTKKVLDRGEKAPVLIFDNVTSELVEVDFRGTERDVLSRLQAQREAVNPAPASLEEPTKEVARGPGRPKLGVVAREVTLLPRHWDWLNDQPGGASVALRKLVDEARRGHEIKDRVRKAQESAYRFLSAMAGNEEGFEEATRALFAGDAKRFEELVEPWPVDVRDHAKTLAAAAFLQEQNVPSSLPGETR